MINDILPDFLNDAWFNQGAIEVTGEVGAYVDGLWELQSLSTQTITTRKVLVPINAKAIADRGLGEFTEGEVFSLFTESPLKLQNGVELRKGDTLTYAGFQYKLISELNFVTHGFWKYMVAKYKPTELNDGLGAGESSSGSVSGSESS